MKAARGKQVLFFPARFDAHEVQAADGYAYQVAVQLFNQNFGKSLAAYVSTDAQGDWWGGAGGGTVAHAAIACFLGDTAEATMAFAATREPEIPRIALVDFQNDCVGTSLQVIRVLFRRYLELVKGGREEEAQKYKLFGVRPDTSSNLRDVSVPPLGDRRLDCGVNPRLVFLMREAIDREWQSWSLEGDDRLLAERYCKDVKIVVTGGFTPARIRQFEGLRVPADLYGVGSWLLSNSRRERHQHRLHRRRGARAHRGPLVRPGQGGPQGLRQPHARTGAIAREESKARGWGRRGALRAGRSGAAFRGAQSLRPSSAIGPAATECTD